MRVLTLDLGSGALKAVLWDAAVVLRSMETPIETRYARIDGSPHLSAEQSPEEWWSAAVRMARSLECAAVDVIAVTGQMHALVPVDQSGNPLGPVAVVPDRRSTKAHTDLVSAFGIERIMRWTGGRIDLTSVLAKARHFSTKNDAAWSAARWLLPPKDFLRMQLTGEAATDPIDAAGTMLYDIELGGWQRDLCTFAGVVDGQLPEILPTVSIGGRLSAEAAESMGLTKGTPVAVCGGDDIETLGAGALRPGDFFEHLGTTGSIYMASTAPMWDPSCRVEVYPDILPGRWMMGGSTSAAGAAIRWIKGIAGDADDWASTEALFQRMEADARPADAVFLPYLSGARAPLWDPARSASILGLRADHGPDEVLRATAEGIAYSLRHVFDVLRSLSSGIETTVMTSGPLGAISSFGQVRSDVYGARVCAGGDTKHATSFAAMAIAECAVTGEDPYVKADGLLRERWCCAPRPGVSQSYNHAYRRYARASALLRDFDREWAEAML